MAAKNLWFKCIVQRRKGTTISDTREAWDRAFGEGKFNEAYPDNKINWRGKAICQHCGEKYHIRGYPV